MNLLTGAREHDLPPKWDGRSVAWEPWEVTPQTFICPPPPPEPCGDCGSTSPALRSIGVVHPLPGDTFTTDTVRTTKSGRQYVSGTHEVAARPVIRLHAFRCPDCHLDRVWDTESDEWWDLDHTDYGDEGSREP